MIPVHLRLSGFLSYLDPVDLDFTSFDLACISGSNGAGKSSLLDAITWSLFGRARLSNDAVINSHAKSAEVILDMVYEGETYRVQRIKPRDKTTVLEFFIKNSDNGWRPLTERSVNKTEERIRETLRMDYDTFTNASFLLQGKADSFAQQKAGDRKRILSSILGLEIWENYKNVTAERRKRLENDKAVLDSSLAEIDKELGEEQQRKERLKQLEDQLSQLQQVRQARESSIDALRRLAASLADQRKLLEVLERQMKSAKQRQDDVSRQLEDNRAERQAYQERLSGEAEVQAAYQCWQQARADLARWDDLAANFRQYEQQRSAPLLAIESERQRLQQELKMLHAEQRAVDESSSRLPVIESQLADAHEQVGVLVFSLNQRPSVEADLRALQTELAEAQAENRSLREKMNELKERIENLKKVSGAACPLCGQPLSAEDRDGLTAHLNSEGTEMASRFRANADLVRTAGQRQQELQTRLESFPPLENELRKQQRLVDQLEDQQTQVKQSLEAWKAGGALRLAELEQILANSNFALEPRAELSKVDAALKELGYDAAAHDGVRRAELEGRASEEALRQLESARAAVGPLDRAITALQAQLTSASADAASQESAYSQAEKKYNEDSAALPDMRQVESELLALQEQENRLHMDVGGARQNVLVLDTLRKRHERESGKRAEVMRAIGYLKSLERAFGKDGVPALLIEEALPEIEEQANEILDRLSGGQMSVRFATQKDYKDKNRDDKKETLDIIITDSSGAAREYELFSGGEAFRVNFAIRLALSRFLAQRAGARLQTLVIDEGFGSQDAEGRQRLIEAINMVKPDFAKILAITHMEELKEAFPVRLEVEKTARGSQVRVLS